MISATTSAQKLSVVATPQDADKEPATGQLTFGALFMLAMNYVILPLSVMGHPLYAGAKGLFDALVSHVLVIGLPISLITAARLGTQT